MKLLKNFESFLQRYQERLEESMKAGAFIFDNVDVLYYNLNKTNLNRGGSYISSSKWQRNKKATINPKNNCDKFFQYTLTVALSHEKIESHPERMQKIKLYGSLELERNKLSVT